MKKISPAQQFRQQLALARELLVLLQEKELHEKEQSEESNSFLLKSLRQAVLMTTEKGFQSYIRPMLEAVGAVGGSLDQNFIYLQSAPHADYRSSELLEEWQNTDSLLYQFCQWCESTDYQASQWYVEEEQTAIESATLLIATNVNQPPQQEHWTEVDVQKMYEVLSWLDELLSRQSQTDEEY